MLYSKLVQDETRQAKVLRSGTAGEWPEVNNRCYPLLEDRGCRKRWYNLLMRPLAAKLLLRLDSSARSGGVFTQHVLSGRASTLLVSRFHFRLSYFHVAR